MTSTLNSTPKVSISPFIFWPLSGPQIYESPSWVTGAQVFKPSPAAFPKALAESLIGSRAARLKPTHWYGMPANRLNLLCHNAVSPYLVYLFSCLFVSVLTNGYLFYSISYYSLLFWFILWLQLSSWPLQTPSSWLYTTILVLFVYLFALPYLLAPQNALDSP